MSSLWSMIRKCDMLRYFSSVFTPEDVKRPFHLLKTARPRLVNITEQYRAGCIAGKDDTFFGAASHLDATPCFPQLWFEWLWPEGTHSGVFCERIDITTEGMEDVRAMVSDGAVFMVGLLICNEFNGDPILRGSVMFCVDRLGQPVGETLRVTGMKDEEDALVQITMMIADVLTTMNTKGTRIEPPFDSKQAQIVKPNRYPCSVWHTIHLPRFARPPLENAEVSPEILERRQHWVRGHRRDYRNGSGMFGRIKALVWVPEYERGNPELGSVKQTYVVHPQRSD